MLFGRSETRSWRSQKLTLSSVHLEREGQDDDHEDDEDHDHNHDRESFAKHESIFLEGEKSSRTRVKMWSRRKVKKVQTEEATPGKCKKIQAQKYGVIKSTKAEEVTRDKSNVCTCLFLLSAGMDQCCHVAKTWPS